MKFLYILCYVIGYVYVAQLGHLATFCADGVGLCSSVALLVFRYGPELVVGYQVGFYEHCYGIVYRSTANAELEVLLKMLHELLYLKASVD